MSFNTAASGNWSNPAVWPCGIIPGINDSVVIRSGHSIVLNITTQIRKLLVEPGATLTLSDGAVVFTVGSNANKTSPVTFDGSLTITNGTIRIYGNLTLTSTSGFNMSGGNIIIDGNSGTASTSIPDGQHLFSVGTSGGNFTFTGGKLQFIDPPLGATSQAVNSPINFGALSTLLFGDGVSTRASNNINGFGGNLLPAIIGKLHVDAASLLNNRIFRDLNPLTVKNELKVFSGHIIQVAPINVQ